MTTRLEQLKLAFSVYTVRMVYQADGREESEERAHWQRHFPLRRLREMGLDTELELEQAQAEALRTLPHVLSETEKLDLLRFFHEAALADNDLASSEVLLLMEGARFLGLPLSSFTTAMSHWSMSRLGISAEERLQIA